MKEADERDHRVEAWVEARLDRDPREREPLEPHDDPRLAGELELARRIDASLRRTFAVPPAPHHDGARHPTGADLSREARSSIGASASGGALVLVGLLAAAAVLLLTRPQDSVFVEPASTPAPGAGGSPPTASAPAAPLATQVAAVDPGVGPLVETEPGAPLSGLTRPNLQTLYTEASGWSADRRQSLCSRSEELSQALERSYGEEVAVRPEAEGRLQGPFASSEWPTGMILTGHPEDAPAVLVAERDSTLTCCLALELPDESELSVFTWRVGDLLLTEITPLSEPRLLDYFE